MRLLAKRRVLFEEIVRASRVLLVNARVKAVRVLKLSFMEGKREGGGGGLI